MISNPSSPFTEHPLRSLPMHARPFVDVLEFNAHDQVYPMLQMRTVKLSKFKPKA